MCVCPANGCVEALHSNCGWQIQALRDLAETQCPSARCSWQARRSVIVCLVLIAMAGQIHTPHFSPSFTWKCLARARARFFLSFFLIRRVVSVLLCAWASGERTKTLTETRKNALHAQISLNSHRFAFYSEKCWGVFGSSCIVFGLFSKSLHLPCVFFYKPFKCMRRLWCTENISFRR